MLNNNFISLVYQSFPGINKLFTLQRSSEGHLKWVDFEIKLSHCECVSKIPRSAFIRLSAMQLNCAYETLSEF